MIAVLDASAGVEIALNRRSSLLFATYIERASKTVTSELYKAETANVLWKYHKMGLLSKEGALRTLKYCYDMVDEYIDISKNGEEALAESIRLNHPAYDLLYMTVARRTGGVLLTLYRKLSRLSEASGVEIVR